MLRIANDMRINIVGRVVRAGWKGARIDRAAAVELIVAANVEIGSA